MTEIILEKIINKLAYEKLIDLTPLHEKTIMLSLNSLGVSLTLYTHNQQVFIFDEVKDVDVSISVGVDALWQLLNAPDINELVRSGAVVLNGELKTAQLFIDVLKHNTIKKHLLTMLPAGCRDRLDTLEAQVKHSSFKDTIISTLIQPKVYK